MPHLPGGPRPASDSATALPGLPTPSFSTPGFSTPGLPTTGPAVIDRSVRFADLADDMLGLLRRLNRQYGSLILVEDHGQRIFCGFGPDYNKRVLSDTVTFHSHFTGVRGPKNSAHRRLTSGLLNMNGDAHKRHRRLMMGPFQRRSFVAYHDFLVSTTEGLLREWQVGQVRDLNTEMNKHLLRITSSILFGLENTEFAFELGHMLHHWLGLNHEAGAGALVSDPKIHEKYQELLAYGEGLEAKIRQMIELRRSSSKESLDVLSLLIRARDEEGGLTDNELIGHAAVLFGAAHLTTAHSMTWTLFLLAQHPQYMRELAHELAEKLQGRAPAMEEMEQLPVLDRIIKESMRILPASAYSQRITAMPTELGPYQLAAGTLMIFSQFVTHRMPALFPDPERFLPDRWKTIEPNPYAYLPFATGPRMCLGGPLALVIIKVVLPMLLQKFRLQLVPNAEINARVIATMLNPIGEVPVQLFPPDGKYTASPIRGNLVDLIQYPEVA